MVLSHDGVGPAEVVASVGACHTVVFKGLCSGMGIGIGGGDGDQRVSAM